MGTLSANGGVLQVRLDSEAFAAIDTVCRSRTPPITRAALVRELLNRAVTEHTRACIADRHRLGTSQHVAALGAKVVKRAKYDAEAPERAKREFERAAAARAAELERERVQREEEAERKVEREARESAERDARLAESEPWELIRGDMGGGGPNGGWTASGEKWLDKNILRLPRGTAWTKLHRGVVVSSGVTETEPLPEVWPSRG